MDFTLIRAKRPAPLPVVRARTPHVVGRRLSRASAVEATSDDDPDPEPVIARSCGGCRVCCTTPSIDDGDVTKAAWSPCPHECEKGCAIYDARPATCRNYECMWVTGELPEWGYPLRTGLMVSRPDPGSDRVTIMEAHAGAAASYWGDRVVKLLARRNLVELLLRDGRFAQVTAASNRVRVR